MQYLDYQWMIICYNADVGGSVIEDHKKEIYAELGVVKAGQYL